MDALKVITAEDSRELTPGMFVINFQDGDVLSETVKEWQDPIEPGSIHCWFCKKDQATELHYHDCDEYWAWVKGRSMVTVRLPDGRKEEFEVGPGTMICCIRGVEHGHQPLEDWGCYEWQGVAHPDGRPGHLKREL